MAQNSHQIAIDSLKLLLSETTDDDSTGHYLHMIANEFYNLSNDSIIHYSRLLEQLSEKTGNMKFLADADYQFGSGYYDQSDYTKSVFHYKRALEYYKDSKDVIKADLTYNLAISYAELSDYDTALEHYYEALEYYEDNKNKNMIAHSYNAISDIYTEIKSFDKAVSMYREALEILGPDYNESFDQSLIFSNLANCYMKQNMLDSAMLYVKESTRIYKQLEESWGLAYNYGIESRVLLGQGRYSDALKSAKQALTYGLDQNSKSEIAESYLLIGQSELMLENVDNAIENISKGINIADAQNILPIKINGLQLLARGYELKGDASNSYLYFKEYTSLKDSVFGLSNVEEINALNSQYENAEKDAALTKQELKLATQTITRNYLIGGILGLSLLGGFFYYRTRSKQKLTRNSLALKQEKIENLEQKQKLLALDYMVQGQEEERKRIAKDLHDGLGGLLSTAKLQLQGIHTDIEKLENLKIFEKAENVIDEAHSELRRIAHNMMPDALMNLGLQAAVEDLSNQVNATKKLLVVTNFQIDEVVITQQQEIIIYRIIQEFLNNTIRHAKAKKLIIQLIEGVAEMHLTLEDDGVGFDLKHTSNEEGIGLKSIRSRAKYLNADFDIISAQGEGTTIEISIPKSEQ